MTSSPSFEKNTVQYDLRHLEEVEDLAKWLDENIIDLSEDNQNPAQLEKWIKNEQNAELYTATQQKLVKIKQHKRKVDQGQKSQHVEEQGMEHSQPLSNTPNVPSFNNKGNKDKPIGNGIQEEEPEDDNSNGDVNDEKNDGAQAV